ncbi:MAG: glycerol dehydrogenase [Christensenella sp.]|uniref:glycerol dehydrogenase n=1 Tax=Christensenella sp. TaxID=1935934 RepID=UPI002B1FB949|nr:glycerol dehydrogenase [Christensenella sp.]MEA5003533.1 glycerol dehydrogenase [Christensenella sp.]
MTRSFISPSKFVQGEGELKKLGEYVAGFGKKAILVAHPDDFARVQDILDESLSDTDYVHAAFSGESCDAEIGRVVELVRREDADVVIGLGGGKALDTAKATSTLTKKPVIIVPTIASTDAPTSALAIIYTQNGEFERYMHLPKNPDLVLVDSGIVAKAPTRFLISGMGDALATVFEARACIKANKPNMSGGFSTIAAAAIAETCYATLLEDGHKAKAACDANVVTKALENIIETNILLSGLGFESSGLAAAHAVHDGLTVLEETHHYFHGEKVAFGTLVQLVLENTDEETLIEVLDFCRSLSLPVCLADLGVEELDDERLMKVATHACSDLETMDNMPFEVTPKDVAAAIRTADIIGRTW